MIAGSNHGRSVQQLAPDLCKLPPGDPVALDSEKVKDGMSTAIQVTYFSFIANSLRTIYLHPYVILYHADHCEERRYPREMVRIGYN